MSIHRYFNIEYVLEPMTSRGREAKISYPAPKKFRFGFRGLAGGAARLDKSKKGS
jgi:hypothetical protein